MAERPVPFARGGGGADERRFPARSSRKGLGGPTVMILSLLEDDQFPPLVKEISEMLGLTRGAVVRRLEYLRRHGLLDDVDSLTAHGRFFLTGDRANFSETALRVCRSCGCTDEHGCPEGCWWVDFDLCSQCADSDVDD